MMFYVFSLDNHKMVYDIFIFDIGGKRFKIYWNSNLKVWGTSALEHFLTSGDWWRKFCYNTRPKLLSFPLHRREYLQLHKYMIHNLLHFQPNFFLSVIDWCQLNETFPMYLRWQLMFCGEFTIIGHYCVFGCQRNFFLWTVNFFNLVTSIQTYL